MTRPVLFLDIDGVLNSEAWYLANVALFEKRAESDLDHYLRDIDPEAVARLNRVVEVSDPTIVLSSTWRFIRMPKVPDILTRRGFTGEIASATPRDPHGHRGREICAWLDAHTDVTTFAVVDDDRFDIIDTPHLVPRFVHTPQKLGLQDEHVDRLIALLGERVTEVA